MQTRRRLLQTAGVTSALLLAGCSSDEPTMTTTETDTSTDTPTATETATPTPAGPTDAALRDRTRAYVELLVDGEYTVAIEEYEYTDAVTEQLDAATLESIWTTQTDGLGEYVDVATVESASQQEFLITDAVVRFTGGRVVVRLVYDDAGRIAGIQFPGAGTYSPPAYADDAAFTAESLALDAGDGCTLPAELTLPTGEESVPGVVLVHGSGPLDMDSTIGPNKPFRDLATGLASNGVAVLRYGKRTSACDVDPAALSLDATVTDDALTAAATLRDRERVSRTAVVGHSLGGMLVPRLLARDESLAAGAMLAAPARPLVELIPEQMEYLLSLDGDLSADDEQRLATVEETIARIRNGNLDAGERPFGLGGSAYWQDLQAYDQVATAGDLDRPLYFLQGERDYQVSLERDFGRWQETTPGRFDAYPSLNHLFMAGEGQSTPNEYFRPSNVAAGVVADLADWTVNETTGY
ncbi:alpha/beta fold hydrolase [Halosegnis longus]|uniref:alpha/beta fold hydrolase n=1 Tax=Halosegnis longus TaxID=2216012 RepID=UPI00096A562F|nr:alpha/beta fold hydrolase [Salella cibi]